MIESAGARRIWIAGMCLLCALLITLQAWAGRYSMDPDGISYLDMADKLQHADFSPLVHPYWSPLYPSLLAFALKAFPSAAMEFPATHLANWLIGLLALAGFTVFLLQYLRAQAAARGTESMASFRCRTGFAYALFLLGTLEAIGIAMVSPDLCVAACIYLAAGLCCRLAGGFGSYITAGLLGVTLGFACLAKAAMVPLGIVLLLLLAIPRLSGAVRRSSITVALLCFAAILGPYVFALSRSQHHLTFGESGKLNYAWSVEGEIPVFAGWMTASPIMGTPAHPPRLLNADPPVLEFKDTVSATYPLWYDPVYFHQGLRVKFSPRKELSAMVRSLQGFRWASGYSLYPLLAGLFVLGCAASLRRVSISLSTSLFLYWSVAAFSLYALVVVLPRYIAPFVVIFWFTVYDAFSSGRLKSVARGAVGATAISILLFQMLVLVKTTAGTDAHLVVAKELERIGLRPGDEIATVGSGFEAYYAQLSKLRIVATIGYTGGPSNDDNLAALNDTDLNAIEDKLRQLHVKAIVGRQSKVLTAGNSWDCIEATGYCVLLLKK
jgi:hypothetical protein